MANNKEVPKKFEEDQRLVVLVAPEKPRYGIRRADWDRIKKNIKKSVGTYGDLTFLQKSHWVLVTFLFTLIPTTLSLWSSLGVDSQLFIVYSILTLFSLIFTIVFYLAGKKIREHKTDRLEETLEDMDELEKTFAERGRGPLNSEDSQAGFKWTDDIRINWIDEEAKP